MDYNSLPPHLPVPLDDGACDHLPGLAIPAIALPSTQGTLIDLSRRTAARTIVYIYPMTGQPGKDLPPGWNDIPGARGCTPQSCSLRDHYQEIRAMGAELFGLSTQITDYQQEMAERLHLPYAVLSDADLMFAHALRLPTFTAGHLTLIKRLTLILRQKCIEKVFYPIFPPDQHGPQVVAWLQHAAWEG